MTKNKVQKSLFRFISWGAIVILVWAIFSNFAFSQVPVPPPPRQRTNCFTYTERLPILKSCWSKDSYQEARNCTNEKVEEFIYSNLKIPPLALQNSIEGIVVVNFIIEKDGKMSNPRIIRDIGGGCGEEALRIVKLLPEWLPGEQRGRKVRVTYNLPVKFQFN